MGSALLLEGAAGIGKTSLLRYACDRAAQAGMTVLVARAAEFEDGYAWGVVRQLFEARIRAQGGRRPAEDAVTLAAMALTRGSRRGEEDSFAVVHGLYWLTADIAQQGPLLLAVDDLHWADQPSQRFIAHLARRLEGLTVLLVVTVREPRSGTAQEKALTAGLAAEPSMIVLRPAALGAAACAELVRGSLGAVVSSAFQHVCRELTGGNPLLLRGLLDSLAAEGMTGTDAEVAHLRRLTPDTVARKVLLQLGRMPAAALAAARAIAVLGTAATAERAGRLARLDSGVCAEAVGALMAEGLVEGERALRFVHPLVRSAVYQDLASPVRQHWHKRAARMLDEDAASAEVTVHLLAAGGAGDVWVVERLRAAAADARGRGAPDVAVQCLERALAEPPSASLRGEVLFELGSAQIFLAPAAAIGHLTEALDRTTAWPGRGQIALALSQALQLCGRFADAVSVLQAALNASGGEGPAITDSLQAALLNVARWDLDTRPVVWPLLARVQARAGSGQDLDPQLVSNMAIELAAAGVDRMRAIQLAREAVRATPRLMSLTSTALAEAVAVLLFAEVKGEAACAAEAWLRLAQQRGWPLASGLAASVASLVALYDGDVRQTLAYGQQATSSGDWISTMAICWVILALVEQGAVDQARAILSARNLHGKLDPTWPYNVARWARGRLHAAAGEHAAAVTDLLTAGELTKRWGIQNPNMMTWRSDAALPLAALGDRDAASRLCAEEIELARTWGANRGLGIALRAAGVIEGANGRGIELLTESVTVLRRSQARLELSRALLDLGAARRRAGSRIQARELLRESLDLSYALGGTALAHRARQELIAAGGKPRRNAVRGRDALTPSELRVAQLAAAGQTNRQIAQALFVTQRTVENHLTSTYSKLGITSRPDLPAALADGPGAPGG
jgi:DNA-binding CsgD family transcriptional regulator